MELVWNLRKERGKQGQLDRKSLRPVHLWKPGGQSYRGALGQRLPLESLTGQTWPGSDIHVMLSHWLEWPAESVSSNTVAHSEGGAAQAVCWPQASQQGHSWGNMNKRATWLPNTYYNILFKYNLHTVKCTGRKCTQSKEFWQTYKSIYSIPNKKENISFTEKGSLGPLDPTPLPSVPRCHPPCSLSRAHTHTVLIFITIVYFACFELHRNGITAHVLFYFWLLMQYNIFDIHTYCHIYLKIFISLYEYTPFLYLFSFYRDLGCF